MTGDAASWLWIPLTIWAGFAQTLRNAAQRHLVTDLGTLGATLVRFLYGLPFALTWLGIVLVAKDEGAPGIDGEFLGWVIEAALAQIAATALVLRVMAERNFTLGVAYSKTELIQVAVFGLIFLGDGLSAITIVAVTVATMGVLFLSVGSAGNLGGFLTGWTSRTALLGLASGACFAMAAVGYRGAAISLEPASYLVAAAWTLAWAQALQTLLLGGWLVARDRSILARLIRLWRPSMFAGFMGAAASIGWFTAFTLESAAHVRTLGLVELLFSYLLSRRLFREHLRGAELAGMGLLMLGLVAIIIG